MSSTLVVRAGADGPPAPEEAATPRGVMLSRAMVAAGLAALVVAANVCVATGVYVAFVSPALGFAAALVVPLVLVYQLVGRYWRWWEGGERLVVSVALTVGLLMVLGLGIDTVLPVLGVSRPLATGPVLLAGDGLDLVLGALAFRLTPQRLRVSVLGGTGWRGRLCAASGGLSVVLAAVGAVRLNNGAGAGATLVALGLIMVTLVGLFLWRDGIGAGVTPLALYGLSLALLFMTSLRGWYTTGHDVQQEMLVFLNTSGHARWSTAIHNGYTACLSITILPTLFLRWTRLADPYVYKVLFQLLYAVCPVVVYYIARRVVSGPVALVSAVYFIGFVGFVQDMPMLNRQEIGFLFFSTALLVLFMSEQSRRRRQLAFCVLAAGMVMSHYSTSYFALAALLVALLLRPVLHGVLPAVARRLGRQGPASGARSPLGWAVVVFVGLAVVVWDGPVTHSGGQVTSEMTTAFHAAFGGGGARAAEAGYSVAHLGRNVTKDQAVAQLLHEASAMRAKSPTSFIAAPGPSTALTPLAPADTLPLTTLGRDVLRSGRNASWLNHVWRYAAAGGLQVLLALGLVLVLFRRRHRHQIEQRDAIVLAIGAAGVTAVQLVLPVLSLDYGVGRAFMQALMVLGPFIVLGSMGLAVGPLRRWRLGLGMAVALGFFATTTGFVPQLIGAYGPQLHLNNSGDYYDRYYLHPQEVAGIQWLQSGVIAGSPRYPDIQMDQDLFYLARSLGGVRAFPVIYPSDIHKDAFVVLGYPTVVNGKTEVTVDGYELWLRYPTRVLDSAKNLIYTNGSTRIYR